MTGTLPELLILVLHISPTLFVMNLITNPSVNNISDINVICFLLSEVSLRSTLAEHYHLYATFMKRYLLWDKYGGALSSGVHAPTLSVQVLSVLHRDLITLKPIQCATACSVSQRCLFCSDLLHSPQIFVVSRMSACKKDICFSSSLHDKSNPVN